MTAVAANVIPLRELFGTLFDALPEGILIIDPSGHIVIANLQIEQMLEYNEGELLGESVEILLPKENGVMPFTHREDFSREPRSRPMGVEFGVNARRSDGSDIPVEISLTPCKITNIPMVIATVRRAGAIGVPNEIQQRLDSQHAVGQVVAFHHKLATVASLGMGVAGIAEAVRQVTGGIVLIEDLEGSISFCTGDRDALPEGGGVWRQLTGLRHAHSFRKDNWIVAVARPGGEILGAVSLYDPNLDTDEKASFALEEAASVLAIELFRLRTLAESELKLWGDLASELLDDADVDRALRHAAALGIEIERLHRAIVIQPGDEPNRQLFPAVRRAARIVGFNATLLTTRGEDIVLLVADEVDWLEFGRVLKAEVRSIGRIGIGDLHELQTLRDSLTEAQLALRIGAGEVIQIDQLGVLGFLAVDSDPARLRAMIDRWIGSLINYDAIHGSELVRTLSEFLRNNGAVESTARALYVHSSTLKYRLRRIQELTGRDHRNPDDRFNLELACRVFSTLESLSAIAFAPRAPRKTFVPSTKSVQADIA